MAKKFKGENSKVTAAKERKAKGNAEAKAKKDAEVEARESVEWAKGAKKGDKKELEAAKKVCTQSRLVRERARLIRSVSQKKAAKKTQEVESFQAENRQPVIELGASNIDDALDLMEAVNESSDAAANSNKLLLDRHPERRAKAAYAAYEERELPKLKAENKGLRLTQLKQILWKDWQKSPENPFNQASLAFDAKRQDGVDLVEQQRQAIEERLRI
ncbi:DUF1014-domain-containing protein [Basidiobolus meristosporus CBS 931.73]|uniref:DUF1014-domain-containing protein n=1 Tax=Basidiobolus meristosporus CBS 931.73 TaxID=1314790 RepID=A0A1Y1YWL0_9FUNG|nr:DUF1014-domain-containing protein [Basidiobolus meristosporus CBS 931.73]|eukprot:ORY02339.1 DUF1014-domain-containing protein [Basidiobolus meristosporus CBS 931.73]